MYELKCPSCRELSARPFVRVDAIAVCEACRHRWQVSPHDITRNVRSLSELPRNPLLLDAPASAGESERRAAGSADRPSSVAADARQQDPQAATAGFAGPSAQQKRNGAAGGRSAPSRAPAPTSNAPQTGPAILPPQPAHPEAAMAGLMAPQAPPPPPPVASAAVAPAPEPATASTAALAAAAANPSPKLRRRRKASPIGLILVVIATLLLVVLVVALVMAINASPSAAPEGEPAAGTGDALTPGAALAPAADTAVKDEAPRTPQVDLAPLWIDAWERVDRPLAMTSKDFPLQLAGANVIQQEDGQTRFVARVVVDPDTLLREAMITLMLLKRPDGNGRLTIFAQQEIPLVLLGSGVDYKLSIPIPDDLMVEFREIDWSINHVEHVPRGLYLAEFAVRYLQDRPIPTLHIQARNLADVALRDVVFAVRALDEQDQIIGQWRYRHLDVVNPGQQLAFDAVLGTQMPTGTIGFWMVEGAGEGMMDAAPSAALH